MAVQGASRTSAQLAYKQWKGYWPQTPYMFPDMASPPTPQYPMPSQYSLHQLLCYSQYNIVHGHCTSILWDLREHPSNSVRHVTMPDILLAEQELLQHATKLPVSTLHVTCGIFPADCDWPIMSYNPTGVTIRDVLRAIYECMQQQLTHTEWNDLCQKQRDRISAAFDLRWRASASPDATRAQGVLRLDCLLRHTLFGGLTLSLITADSCILTLRCPYP